MPAARTMPTTTPSRLPAIPSASPWRRMRPSTWREVVPAARSRPNSRVRSPTVMASVLPTRNAPTTMATRPNRNATLLKLAWAAANRAAASAAVSTMNGSSRRSVTAATASVTLVSPTSRST